MTYCEKETGNAFDWYKALCHPPAFDSPKHRELQGRAQNWVTCACGNQCAEIPRDNTGAPLDPVLRSLGRTFYATVCSGTWGAARTALRTIEERSREILDSMKRQLVNENEP